MSDPDFDPNSFTDSEGELCRETGDVEESVPIFPATKDLPQSSQGLTQVSGELVPFIDAVDLLSNVSSLTTSTPKPKRRKVLGSRSRKRKGNLFSKKYPRRSQILANESTLEISQSQNIASQSVINPPDNVFDTSRATTAASKISFSLPSKKQSGSKLLPTYDTQSYVEKNIQLRPIQNQRIIFDVSTLETIFQSSFECKFCQHGPVKTFRDICPLWFWYFCCSLWTCLVCTRANRSERVQTNQLVCTRADWSMGVPVFIFVMWLDYNIISCVFK